MSTKGEAQRLSDFLSNQYKQAISLQNYTSQALSDCVTVLAELAREFALTPLVVINAGRSGEWKHLLHCCRPALENLPKSWLLCSEALPQLNQIADIRLLEVQEPLLDEWFLLVYSAQLTFLILAQAPQRESNEVPITIIFERPVIAAAITWLNEANQLALEADLNRLTQAVQSLSLEQQEQYFSRAMAKLAFNLNRAPIENDRITQEMESALYKLTVSNSELAILNRMLELISRSLDPCEIYQGVLNAVEIADLEAAIILLWDEQRHLKIDFQGGVTEEAAEAIREGFIDYFGSTVELPKELQILYTNDLLTTTPCLANAAQNAHIQTFVMLPLRSRNATIGIMLLTSGARRNFSNEDCRLLASIGSQVGIAIESAILYERSQHLARQMGALIEVGTSISSHLEIKPLLLAIVENAGKLLDADHTLISVVFLDKKAKELSIMAEWSIDEQSKTTSLTDIIQRQEPLQGITQFNTDQSMICFPIIVADRSSGDKRSIGTFCASRRAERKKLFTQYDIDLLSNLTIQVSTAIENAELYAKIVAANEQLREAIRLKDELVSMVAHDFRSPLTSIQAFSELLQDRVQDPGAKKYLTIINRQSKHLASLASDTLTMSRLESGNFPLDFKLFGINELIATLAEARSADTTIDLKFEMLEFDTQIMGDQRRIYEVLDNLIGNAIKYSPDGAHVRVYLTEVATGIQVSIADKGMGIAPYDMAKLFQKFSRLDEARQRQIAGTGLGLYICRSIIEAHGGHIWVDSEVGAGSTFHFILPLQGKRTNE